MRQTSISGTARMLDPILELRGGSVYYPGGKQALKQVSAAFYPGEKTAVDRGITEQENLRFFPDS